MPRAAPVFTDGPVVTKTCPVLAFSSEVEYVLQWFAWCYSVELVGFCGVTCRRMSLPEAGSVGEQDAWLWLRLQALQATMQHIVSEQSEKRESRSRAEREAAKAHRK